MALLNETLSVWEIAFRWANLDPGRRWWRIPLLVRDNFRIILDAIWAEHLECWNISNQKRRPSDDTPPEFFIRTHIDAIEDCVEGKRYPRTLLQFFSVERWAFLTWCQRRNIPLPEFWFPAGWKLEYQWPDGEDEAPLDSSEPIEEQRIRLDKRHRCLMACQQIALAIWAKEPRLTIKEVANRHEVQELGGGGEYEIETVQEWIGAVDPRDPAKKRGRKRKNNSAPPDSSSQ